MQRAAKPHRAAPGVLCRVSAWQCAKHCARSHAATKLRKKRAKAGQDVANHPARLLFEDAKRALHVSYSYSTPNVCHPLVQRRPPAKYSAAHSPRLHSPHGPCPRPAPVPCFTGREKCCIMSLQGAALLPLCMRYELVCRAQRVRPLGLPCAFCALNLL